MDYKPRILSGMHPQVAEILSGAQRGEWGVGCLMLVKLVGWIIIPAFIPYL